MGIVQTIQGTYGSGQTPTDIFTYENRNGTTWYVCEGAAIVNLSPEPLTEGIDVETIPDIDVFTWDTGINSEDELTEAVEA